MTPKNRLNEIKQIEMFEEVGIQYLIVNLDFTREFEELEQFAKNVVNEINSR